MPPIALSPSTLNFFRDCPLCFWLAFRKDINPPAGIFPSLPSGMDKAIKEHFDLYRPNLPPELAELKGVGLFGDKELLKAWQSNFKGVRWEDKKGNVLRGAVDDILEKDGKLIAIDFKTRGFPCKHDTHEHYQDQMNIYTFLLEKNGFATEHYAYLLFYYPECMKEGICRFNTKLIKIETKPKEAEKLFKAAVKCLEGKQPKPAEDCEMCEYIRERTNL